MYHINQACSIVFEFNFLFRGGGADLSKILSKETLFANLQNPNPWGKCWGGEMKYLKLLFCH